MCPAGYALRQFAFVVVDLGMHPFQPFRILPGDFLITRALLRYTNNASQPDFRWFWHVHQAHPPQDGAFDFGGAPDKPYPTLLANNGARHVIVPPVYLGFNIDSEGDGSWAQPSDQIFAALPLVEPGISIIAFFVPATATGW